MAFRSEEILEEFNECARVKEYHSEVEHRMFGIYRRKLSDTVDKRRARAGTKLCTLCDRLKAPGRTMCSAHLNDNAMYARARVSRHMDEGLCVHCSSERTTGHTMCSRHLEATRERRAIRRAAGICLFCKLPAEHGLTVCASHRAKSRPVARVAPRLPKKRASRSTSHYLARRAAGLCENCASPSVEGKSLCQSHLEAKKTADRARYLRRKNGLLQ